MVKQQEPNFVVRIPLQINQYLYSKLETRFEIARIFYNKILAECIKRKKHYRETTEYKEAAQDYKKYKIGKCKDKKKLKSKFESLFREAENKSNFYFRSAGKKYGKVDSIETYGYKIIRQSDARINYHLDAQSCNTLSERAFNAVKYHKKVYFKKYNRDFITAIDGKNLSGTLTWKNNSVKWFGLWIPSLINENDVKHKFVLDNLDKIGHVNITRERVRGVWHYYANLVCKGVPPIKPNQVLGIGKVGVDFGPSTIYLCTEKLVQETINLAKKLKKKQSQLRIVQRKLDRQRRANNPENYNKNGTVKKGVKKWKISNKQKLTQTKLQELHRVEKAYRRNLHGQVVNLIRSYGDEVYLEKLSYKSWQRNRRFSRSVQNKAPGMLCNLLKYKFVSTGGRVNEINSFKAKLSQTCICGEVKKKHLSERVHKCEICGFEYHRDFLSALLSICVNLATDEVNLTEVQKYFRKEIPTLAGIN